jgi:hypothetical protein
VAADDLQGRQALARGDRPADADGRSMPVELVDALSNLMAAALVADLRAFPNLLPVQDSGAVTVVTRRGADRG